MSRTLMRIAVLVVLVCSVVFAGLQGATVVHAARAHAQGTGPQPNVTTIVCLDVVFDDVTAIGTNTAKVLGEIDNNCGFTVVSGDLGSAGMTICPTAFRKNGSDDLSFPPLGVSQHQLFQLELTGWCEGCTNHVPDSWPPFDFEIGASASGKNGAGNIIVESNDAESTIHGMPNSPNFTIPC